MEADKVLVILTVYMAIQLFITGMIIFQLIDNGNKAEATMEVLRDFSLSMKIMDKKIIGTMNAHNTEVESWYTGNDKIQNVVRSFMSSMGQENSTEKADFEECIKQYKDYYQLIVPHIKNDGDVDGYVIWMYGKEEFDEIGYVAFTKDFAKFAVSLCGSFYYNVTEQNLTYYPPEVIS